MLRQPLVAEVVKIIRFRYFDYDLEVRQSVLDKNVIYFLVLCKKPYIFAPHLYGVSHAH